VLICLYLSLYSDSGFYGRNHQAVQIFLPSIAECESGSSVQMVPFRASPNWILLLVILLSRRLPSALALLIRLASSQKF
jgi:hypothetical protein